MLKNKVYDVLKWVTIMCLPALGLLYSTLAGIWGFPYGEEIQKTFYAVQTFLGALLGISTYNYYKNKNEDYDTIEELQPIEENDEEEEY